MKLLLINPRLPGHRIAIYVPLGLAYISAYMKQFNHRIEAYDIGAFQYTDEQVEEKMKASDADIFCIGGIIPQYKYIKWLSSIIKKHHPDKTIVVGGGLTNVFPKVVCETTDIDITVFGEAEETMKEITEALNGNMKFADIKGICYKEKGKVYQNESRPPNRNLDSIPFPDYEMFPMDIYLERQCWGAGPLRSINMVTARGCPYRCNYCASSMGRKFVFSRTVDNVLQEMEWLKNRFNIEYFYFADETFTYNRKWVEELCQKLIKNNWGVKFGFQSRVDLVDENLFKLLKEAGCITVQYGIESGSNKTLKRINKGYMVDKAQTAVDLTLKYGFNSMASIIIGIPGETIEDMNETMEFCRKNVGMSFFYSYLTPFPTTPMYDEMKKAGRIPPDEELLLKYGEFGYDIAVNLSDLSKEELVANKERIEAEIAKANAEEGFFFLHQKLVNKHETFADRIKEYSWKYGSKHTVDYIVPYRRGAKYLKQNGVKALFNKLVKKDFSWALNKPQTVMTHVHDT